MGDDLVHRALGRSGIRAGAEGGGVEAVESFRTDVLGGRDLQDLGAERAIERDVLRQRQGIGDRVIGQRRREQQRAIGELPQR
jgi:hypothetical protein